MWGFSILVLLLLLLALSMPTYPYSRAWGYTPVGGLAILLLIWVFLLYFGWVAIWWPWANPGLAT